MNTDILNATIVPEQNGNLMVEVTTEGLDRRDVYGWSVGSDRRLAERLVAAIHAGKALTVEGVGRDTGGKTYLRTRAHVLGRRMAADLKGLGF